MGGAAAAVAAAATEEFPNPPHPTPSRTRMKSEVGRVSPTGKSFRVVRARVRAVRMPSEIQARNGGGGGGDGGGGEGGRHFPFPFWPKEVFPFPLRDISYM